MENVLIKFYQIYKTCVELLIDRGYDKDFLEKTYLNISEGDFQKLYRKNRFNILAPYRETKDKVAYYAYVMILGNGVKLKKDVLKKILSGVNHLREISEQMTKTTKINLILVIDPANTMTALKLVRAHNQLMMQSSGIAIDVFYHNQLQINITKHQDVPRHILMMPDEIEKLKKDMSVTSSQLPRILATDPVARYYGAKRGDVFKIIRPSLSAGQAMTYRQVV